MLTNKKFEIFRKIVLLQNGVDITDEDVDPIMKKVYYEDMKRLGQGKRKEIITEEDRLDLLSLNLHCFRQNLKEMSIREYLEKTDKLLARDVYLAQLNGQMYRGRYSGTVKRQRLTNRVSLFLLGGKSYATDN